MPALEITNNSYLLRTIRTNMFSEGVYVQLVFVHETKKPFLTLCFISLNILSFRYCSTQCVIKYTILGFVPIKLDKSLVKGRV